MKHRVHGILVCLFLAAACGTSDPAPVSTRPVAPKRSNIVASVAHRDAQLGLPTFAWINRQERPRFSNAVDAAQATAVGLADTFAFRPEMVSTLGPADIDARGGTVVVRYHQRIGNIEVFRGGLNIALARDFEPVAASGLVAPSARGSERPFRWTIQEAMAVACNEMSIAPSSLVPAPPADDDARFDAPGLSSPARLMRVFFPIRSADGGTELEPAYHVEIMLARGQARSFVISAESGAILFENNLRRSDAFSYRVYADPVTFMPFEGPQGHAFTPHPTGIPDRRKPTWVSSELVTLANVPFSKNDPWLPPGATKTSGNNVMAIADLVAPDGMTEGTDTFATVTAPGTFGNAYNTNASPGASAASIQASVTHLFYVTNFLHDWFYDAGFDEKSGNHQQDNLGRGGKSNDPLYADAQDYSARNNAVAIVPRDGAPPQIQMFIFSGSSQASLVVSAPTNVAGTKAVAIASGFGKDVFNTSGSVVLAVDEGGADPNDGCEPLAALAGKIALIHRGTCSFAQKAQNAEAAGAIGAIIMNVASSPDPQTPPFMGGTASNITIPVLSVGAGDGQALKGAITAGLNVTMKREAGVDLDGGLDTTIVAHEWGHVLSGRLIGDGNGLSTNQAGGLGEGWGDFTALLLVARADSAGKFTGVYSHGGYAMSGSGDDIYFGTRRLPYSVDFKKNPLTFRHIQNGVALPTGVPISFGEDGSFNAEVHNTGEVWGAMLWECYVALLSDTRYSIEQARERMKRYLVASLKLTPSDPTLLEARDAVLAAARATDEQDFQAFWRAFARRGAGAGASGPPKDSANNAGVEESFDFGNAARIVQGVFRDDAITCDRDGILDSGEVGTIEVTLRNEGAGSLESAKAVLTSKTTGVVLDAAAVAVPPLKPFETTTFPVKVSFRAPASMARVEVEASIVDASLRPERPVRITVPTHYDADEAPDAGKIDHVETVNTAWTVAGTKKWARATEGTNRFWSVSTSDSGDHRLVSPPFNVEGSALTIAYKHRWFFRSSTRRQVDIDGAVVEISFDQGQTWKDVSEFGSVDYTSKLDSLRSENVLKGRSAYANKSPGYPAEWVQSRIELAVPERAEKVQIRFRAGTTRSFFAANAEGWDIDDIELGGITQPVFWDYVPQVDSCDPNGPTVNAGPPKSARPRTQVTLEGSGTHPKQAPLVFMWRQIAGPPVTLNDSASRSPSFEAPAEAPATLTFELRAHDGALVSAASRVDVTVTEDKAAPETTDGCSCRAAPSPRSLPGIFAMAAAVVAFRRRRTTRS